MPDSVKFYFSRCMLTSHTMLGSRGYNPDSISQKQAPKFHQVSTHTHGQAASKVCAWLRSRIYDFFVGQLHGIIIQSILETGSVLKKEIWIINSVSISTSTSLRKLAHYWVLLELQHLWSLSYTMHGQAPCLCTALPFCLHPQSSKQVCFRKPQQWKSNAMKFECSINRLGKIHQLLVIFFQCLCLPLSSRQ